MGRSGAGPRSWACPGSFVDEAFRERVARDCLDAKVRSFWLDEFPRYPERLQSEAVAPLQNKLGQLLAVPALRNVLGQVTSTTWATCKSLAQQLEELLRTRGLTEAQCEEITAYVKEAVLQSYRNGVKGRVEHAPQTATPAPQRRPARRTR